MYYLVFYLNTISKVFVTALTHRQTDRRVDHNTPHPYRGAVISLRDITQSKQVFFYDCHWVSLLSKGTLPANDAWETTLQGGRTQPPFGANPPLLPFRSPPFVSPSFSYPPYLSPPRSDRHVKIGGLESAGSFPSGVRKSIFGTFLGKEMCLVANILVLFVGTKMST